MVQSKQNWVSTLLFTVNKVGFLEDEIYPVGAKRIDLLLITPPHYSKNNLTQIIRTCQVFLLNVIRKIFYQICIWWMKVPKFKLSYDCQGL